VAKTISGYAACRFLVCVRRGQWLPEPGEIVVLDLGRKATVDDLRYVDARAEIVDGNLVVIAPSGFKHVRARGFILHSLMLFENDPESDGIGLTSSVAFLVDAPHRQSICADVSWYTGPIVDGHAPVPPVFAAEVRDFASYGEEAEAYRATKRADFFAAGTQVVWDADVLREKVIRVYRATDPENPTVYRRGEVAEAEPAVPGWRFPVDELWD
jgi:Uma2 family endonuclease